MLDCLALNDLNIVMTDDETRIKDLNIDYGNSKNDSNSCDNEDIVSAGDDEVDDKDDNENSNSGVTDDERFIQFDEDEDDVSQDEEVVREERSEGKPIVLVKSQKRGRKMFYSGYFFTVESDVGN